MGDPRRHILLPDRETYRLEPLVEMRKRIQKQQDPAQLLAVAGYGLILEDCPGLPDDEADEDETRDNKSQGFVAQYQRVQ
jgi:hypothetical protein